MRRKNLLWTVLFAIIAITLIVGSGCSSDPYLAGLKEEGDGLRTKVADLENQLALAAAKEADCCWFQEVVLANPDIGDMQKNVQTVNMFADDINNELKGQALARAMVLQAHIERLLDRDEYSQEAWGLIQSTFPNGNYNSDWHGYVLHGVACDPKVPVDKAKFFAEVATRHSGHPAPTLEDYSSRCQK